MYYETRGLLSSTNSQIYDKEEHDHVKVIISYKYAIDLNKLLFESSGPKYVIVRSSRIMLRPCMYKQYPSKYYM